MVMPSWQLESCVDRDFRHLSSGTARGVAVVHGALHSGLVKGNKGKFDGDKKAGAEDQQEACREKKPLHLAACLVCGASEGDCPGETARRRMVGRADAFLEAPAR